MNNSLFFTTDATILCLILFTACILMVRLGRFVRNKFFHRDQAESKGGVNSLLAALFGLWGFILAFTFGSAATRFDNISNAMFDEYNAIRNVIYRSELFPDSIENGFREDLKQYLQLRGDYYKNAKTPGNFNKTAQETRRISKILWARTERASMLPDMSITGLNMFAALTSMFDLAAKRDAMLLSGMPDLIFYLLFFLALVVSFTGGFTTPIIQTKEWIVISSFILLACIIIYITLDISRPLRGLIRPDFAEKRIEQLQTLFLDTTTSEQTSH